MTAAFRDTREFADLEIRIGEKRGLGYPVEITFRGSEQFPRGYLAPDLLPWQPGDWANEDGERLFRCLFEDTRLMEAWAEARGRAAARRVRLRLGVGAPELEAVPWELLRETGPGIGAHWIAADAETPFSRYLAGVSRGGPVVAGPLRCLVAIAAPAGLGDYDLPPIDVARERRALESALGGISRKRLELDFLEPRVTLSALEAELRNGYHALHFVGHGRIGQRRRGAALFLVGEDGGVARVGEKELADMIGRQAKALRFVFLASCSTASGAEAFRGLGPRLVDAGVPAVAAMQGRVPMATARRFARVFYSRLLDHGLVDLAANEARSVLLSADPPGAAAPVLYLRLLDGVLLERRRPPRWPLLAAAALALLLVAAAVLWSRWLETSRAMESQRLSSSLAAEAKSHMGNQLDLALLLSVEAARLAETKQSVDSLLTVLALHDDPGLARALASHGEAIGDIAFSPDGTLLASASRTSGMIHVYATTSGRRQGAPMIHDGGVRSIQFDPVGETLASVGGDHRVVLWNLADRTPLALQLAGQGRVTSVAFSQDARTLAVGDQDGSVRLWQVASARPLTPPLAGGPAPVSSLAFSPLGTAMASGSEDGGVRLWRVIRDGPSRPTLAAGQALASDLRRRITGLVFTPGGGYLIAVAANGRIRPWLVATGGPFGETLVSQVEAVRSAAISSDGQRFALGSEQGTIALGDVASRTRIGSPVPGHGAAVLSIAMSPSGSETLASGAADGSLLLWDLRLEALQRCACRLAGRSLTRDEWSRFLGDDRRHQLTCSRLLSPPAP